MDKALLKSAQQGLRILDVALRGSHVALSQQFDPKYQDIPRDIQLLQQIVRSETVEVEDDGSPHHLFRVFARLGIRWMRETELAGKAAQANAKDRDEADVVAVIEATFVAEYEMVNALEQPALDEFALRNAPWHIWPYWREYAANQCARLNIPKATMPMQCLAPRDDAPGGASDP